MPRIAIRCYSTGFSQVNVSDLTIAISPPGYAYNVVGNGDGQAIFVGVAVTSSMGGSQIPQTDAQGRQFPSNPLGKAIQFELATGNSFRAPHRIIIKIQSLEGSQPTLYEWEGRIPISSTIIGGFKIDGILKRPFFGGQTIYRDIMWGRNNFERNFERDANDALDRAAERVNSRRR